MFFTAFSCFSVSYAVFYTIFWYLLLFIFLQFSTLTFIEIYRFIDRNFSKKTIKFVFIVCVAVGSHRGFWLKPGGSADRVDGIIVETLSYCANINFILLKLYYTVQT
jgi:hypothetical protein